MPMVEEPLLQIKVEQTTSDIVLRRQPGEDNSLLAVVNHFKPMKPCYTHRLFSRSNSTPVEYNLIGGLEMSCDFSYVKLKCHESFYRWLLKCYLSLSGVPESLHDEALDKLFPVIHACETCEMPVVLAIFDSIPCQTDEVLSFTPTAESAIQDLERVRLDAAIVEQSPTCAICLKDYAPEEIDELMLTRMPCSHYFHGLCILSWLHCNHLCPMCRYAMPVDQADRLFVFGVQRPPSY